MNTKKFDIREYHFEPGLTGNVRIENVSTAPDGQGWSGMTDIKLPGSELLAVVKEAAPRPMVGVSVLVVDERDSVSPPYVLLGKRHGSHGDGEYGTPGGHMENGERPEETALREFREECGDSPVLGRPRVLCFTNMTGYLPKHYLDIGVVVPFRGGMPKNMEPDKCEGWEWHRIDQLPTPRFGPVDNLVIAYETGQTYFPNADS
jgi:8-oxo-dGTP diphosphatase